MSIDNNLLLNVTRLSMMVCRRHLAPSSPVKSPHRFTQTRLMTCLILKTYLKTTCRGIMEILNVSK